MSARFVGINSTFEQQRQVINALAEDVFNGVVGVAVTRSITIGTRSGAYVQNAVGTGIIISLRTGIGTATF